jgi:thymidylate synthase (FAD)
VLCRPIVTLLDATPDAEAKIVHAARTCTNSHSKSTPESDLRLLKSLIAKGHHSTFEHASATFEITCSRVVLAEITRHRHLSFSVESQRYVKYNYPKWSESVYCPPELDSGDGWNDFTLGLHDGFERYQELMQQGVPAQLARYVLPNATLTKMVVTGNLRSWYEYLKKRLAKGVQPEHYAVAAGIRDHLLVVAPVVFSEFSEVSSGRD